MQVDQDPINGRVARLAKKSGEILQDEGKVYDLVGKRLAWWAVGVEAGLKESPFRLGIVGFPNRGKTTFAYSMFSLLKAYGMSAQYVDLDVHSNSGPAIAGEIEWRDRKNVKGFPIK